MAKDRKRSNVNQRAKSFEKNFAKFLRQRGIPAKWVESRMFNYGKSDTDVKVLGFPRFKIDCKTKQKWMHHTLFEQELIERYIKKPIDQPVMPTKLKGQRGCYVTITDELFAELLLCYLNCNMSAADRLVLLQEAEPKPKPGEEDEVGE